MDLPPKTHLPVNSPGLPALSTRPDVDIGLENNAYLMFKQIAPPVKDQKQAQTRFAVGQEIDAVIATGGNRVQLSMK